MIEDCCYILAILIEMVKLFRYMLCFCDDFDFNILGTLYYELLYAHCIKEKERIIREEYFYCFGKYHPKNFD